MTQVPRFDGRYTMTAAGAPMLSSSSNRTSNNTHAAPAATTASSRTEALAVEALTSMVEPQTMSHHSHHYHHPRLQQTTTPPGLDNFKQSPSLAAVMPMDRTYYQHHHHHRHHRTPPLPLPPPPAAPPPAAAAPSLRDLTAAYCRAAYLLPVTGATMGVMPSSSYFPPSQQHYRGGGIPYERPHYERSAPQRQHYERSIPPPLPPPMRGYITVDPKAPAVPPPAPRVVHQPMAKLTQRQQVKPSIAQATTNVRTNRVTTLERTGAKNGPPTQATHHVVPKQQKVTSPAPAPTTPATDVMGDAPAPTTPGTSLPPKEKVTLPGGAPAPTKEATTPSAENVSSKPAPVPAPQVGKDKEGVVTPDVNTPEPSKEDTSQTPSTTTSTPPKPVYKNQLLPVKDRQPPKRLSRKERRRLLSAPLPRPCLTHTPTLRELQSTTFSDYVQKIVLGSAVPYEEESDDEGVETDSEDEEDWKTRQMPLAEGIAKVSLPKGFWPTEQTSWTQGDRTGRGVAWQPGTPLGDYRIEVPMEQHVRGLAGVYEYSFVDKGPVTFSEFRDRADKYRTEVVGCPYDVFEEKKEDEQDPQDKNERRPQDDSKAVDQSKITEADKPAKRKNVFANEEERLEYLERFFWKRLGPTMPPAWYGADHEGTLFPEEDDATGWSIAQLDSCLHVLPHVPGVTSPYLYAGMWGSVFCAHTEDMNLLSINYLHAGAPKVWYAIAPGPDSQRFESLCASSFAGTPSTKGCKDFLRHKRSLLSPKVLLKAGIKFTTAIQRPGDAIITFPAGYHFGFNSGFNVAEATNFAVPEWIPFGLKANVCLCRPDSVRIDMVRLTGLLEEFDQDQKRYRRKRLSWKEWSAQKHQKRQTQQQHQPKPEQRRPPGINKKKRKVPLSEQQKKREFWIEVVKPLTRGSKKSASAKSQKLKKEEQPECDEAGRPKRKRKLTAKAAKWEREQLKKKALEVAPKKPSVVVEEIWHLAKPLPRKAATTGVRVLCLLPGTTMGYAPKNSWKAGTVEEPELHHDLDDDDELENRTGGRLRKNVTDDEEEEDEQCFTGQIVEISDDHARIHIDGLPRSEDVWLDLNVNKVFLDGGRWDEEEEVQEDGRSLPQLHYWEEMDSKRRRL
uniref:JmjC domain-containing protein n=1 Tax=Amphora coffeiformis TaxID=265554 RepID=A0A7S3L0Y8_9STRA